MVCTWAALKQHAWPFVETSWILFPIAGSIPCYFLSYHCKFPHYHLLRCPGLAEICFAGCWCFCRNSKCLKRTALAILNTTARCMPRRNQVLHVPCNNRSFWPACKLKTCRLIMYLFWALGLLWAIAWWLVIANVPHFLCKTPSPRLKVESI